MIDYSNFRKSLKHLELQWANYGASARRPELGAIDREAIAESVIQRFETCYDTLWKHLRRYLVEELGLPEVPTSPKPIFRLAAQNQLLRSPIDNWLRYADARTDTAHDYSGEKAAETLQLAGDFIRDAVSLFETLTGSTWE